MAGSVTWQSIGSISYEVEIGCEIVYKNSICLESQMSRIQAHLKLWFKWFLRNVQLEELVFLATLRQVLRHEAMTS